MKLASNVNAHALPRPLTTSETMLSNNNMEAENNETLLSNSSQRGHGRTTTVDNLEGNETVIADEMPLSTPINCNSKELNNNNSVLSNQLIKTVSSKRPTRIVTAVDNEESWYTAIGLEETPHEVTNNSTGSSVENNNKNNISNNKERCATQKRTARDVPSGTEDDHTQSGAEYPQPNKHSFQAQVSLETETHDGACPDFKSNSDKVSLKCKTPATVSDRTTRDVEADSSCIESSRLSTTSDIQERKNGRLKVSLIESDYPISNNTAIIKVTQENSKTLPEYLKTLDEGKSVCGDTYVSHSKPDWFDMEKFQRGQRFAINHIFSLMFAELISLMILFAFRGGLEPLIFTGKSDTPFKAFKRYLSTIVRVKSWYEGDIWDVDSVAHKNLKAVRRMHEAVRKDMEAAPHQEVAKRVTLENKRETQPMWTHLHEEILVDFRSSCPFSGSPMTSQKEVYINQFDMGLTQFGFIGLILVFPKMFGIHYASDKDFEGFAHFWRTIGYLLGTEDRFNLCSGDLKTVRQRCLDIIDHWVRPKFRELSRDWIHMSRCVYKGVSFYVPNVKFEVLLLYLCRVLDIQAIKLAASLTFWQYCIYLEIIFLYWFTFRLPGMWWLHNWLINFAVKHALHMGPERLTKLEQRVHPYEMYSNTTSTKL